MIKRLGFVDKEKVWKWVKKYNNEMKNERWNGKENKSGRKDLWFGVGVSLGINNRLFEGKEVGEGLSKIGNKWWNGEEWNSVLLLKYDSGVELKPHIDREIFDKKVVIINISEDSLFGGSVEFIYGGKTEILSNGEVIEINSQIIHGVKKVISERWSLSFRKVLV